jgi:hypothetical protein
LTDGKSSVSQDILLAYGLLDGSLDFDRRGLPREQYLKEGSVEEKEAREAISRLLRSPSPLDRQVREMLAALFDPRPNTSPWGKRRIVFRFRSSGNRQSSVRNSHIVSVIWDAVRAGAGVNKAVDSAIDKTGLSRERLMELWKRYRPILEKTEGPLSRPSRIKRKGAR